MQTEAQFIGDEEGKRLTVYIDSAGYPTIGIGHKILPHEDFNGGITEEQCQEIYARDAAIAWHHIVIRVPNAEKLNPNQRTAVKSLVFNNGETPLLPGHTLGDALRAQDYTKACDSFTLYHHDHASGHPCNSACDALLHRRQREQVKFKEPCVV